MAHNPDTIKEKIDQLDYIKVKENVYKAKPT